MHHLILSFCFSVIDRPYLESEMGCILPYSEGGSKYDCRRFSSSWAAL